MHDETKKPFQIGNIKILNQMTGEITDIPDTADVKLTDAAAKKYGDMALSGLNLSSSIEFNLSDEQSAQVMEMLQPKPGLIIMRMRHPESGLVKHYVMNPTGKEATYHLIEWEDVPLSIRRKYGEPDGSLPRQVISEGGE